MIHRFVQKSDCDFPDFSRTKLLLFPDFSRHFAHLYVNKKTLQNWLLNVEISYTMYSSILNTKWDSNFWTLNFRCFVSWTARKLTNTWVINRSALQFSRIFPDFSIPMIIFKAFQGLQNFYTRFQDFPYFSRICTNPGYRVFVAAAITTATITIIIIVIRRQNSQYLGRIWKRSWYLPFSADGRWLSFLLLFLTDRLWRRCYWMPACRGALPSHPHKKWQSRHIQNVPINLNVHEKFYIKYRNHANLLCEMIKYSQWILWIWCYIVYV